MEKFNSYKFKQSILRSAEWYATQGVKVFPVVFPINAGGEKDKSPLVKWKKEATTNMDVIQLWFDTVKEKNIGAVCGFISDKKYLIVIDFDTHNEDANGVENLVQWEEQNGALKETFTVKTCSGGKHMYYFSDEPFVMSANPNIGIDIRGVGKTNPNGSYVVGLNSVDYIGNYYTVEKDVPIQWMDEHVKSFIRGYVQYKEPSSCNTGTYSLSNDDVIQEGGRTQALIGLIASLKGNNIPVDTIRLVVQEHNKNHCVPPLSETELENEVFPALDNLQNGYGDYKRKGGKSKLYKDAEYIREASIDDGLNLILRDYKSKEDLMRLLMAERWLF